MKHCFLGIDLGTSSIKVALVDAETGERLASASSPDIEMPILSPQPGFAEQDPREWWKHFQIAVGKLPKNLRAGVQGIGISYQMHGLVLLDETGEPTRNAIIWCDGRAAPYGAKAFEALGEEYCLKHLLNSPGNFTAAKLRWVIENEPATLEETRWAMLPGDYLALMLSGTPATTASGLSEMAAWDFEADKPAHALFKHFEINETFLPPLVSTFGHQSSVSPETAAELGIPAHTPILYRAGDQPNNALALSALEPGEVAATAGTSGVIYGVTDQRVVDPAQRVNTFLHVNHTKAAPRYGILCCVNGCGVLLSWMRNKLFEGALDYPQMNDLAAQAPVGSAGLTIHPFGNGAERILRNEAPGARLSGLDFSNHGRPHFFRAAQEGIAFSLKYGIESARKVSAIRASHANLFLSPVFAQTMADLTNSKVEIQDTDGALGAARGAAIGAGKKDFPASPTLKTYEPLAANQSALEDAYGRWVRILESV